MWSGVHPFCRTSERHRQRLPPPSSRRRLNCPHKHTADTASVAVKARLFVPRFTRLLPARRLATAQLPTCTSADIRCRCPSHPLSLVRTRMRLSARASETFIQLGVPLYTAGVPLYSAMSADLGAGSTALRVPHAEATARHERDAALPSCPYTSYIPLPRQTPSHGRKELS